MPIFGSPKNKHNSVRFAISEGKLESKPCRSIDPFERKSLASSLAASVKTLFSRRSSASPTVNAASASASVTPPLQINTKRRSVVPAASTQPTIRHTPSAPALCASDAAAQSDRYTEARAKALAETIRRLHQSPVQTEQQQPDSPITPSSIDTGKTLPCFPEEDEYEQQKSVDSDNEPVYALSPVTRAGISRLNSTSSNASTRGSKCNSISSSFTLAARSRPTSFNANVNDSILKTASPKSYKPRRHSMMLGDSREALASPQFTQPQKQSLPKPRPQPQFHSNRYTVTMTQNLNRRFQTPLHHEYEQRIHCLHAHYTDVIERFEMQLQIQAANQHKYERSLCELRRANAVLQARESELRDRLQRKSSIGMPQKLVEIVDHYQQHMQNMSRETRTAQEWVIALAELVVGPKKETQSWDDWLNQSLEVLQKRHETQDKHTNALASPLQSPRC